MSDDQHTGCFPSAPSAIMNDEMDNEALEAAKENLYGGARKSGKPMGVPGSWQVGKFAYELLEVLEAAPTLLEEDTIETFRVRFLKWQDGKSKIINKAKGLENEK